MRREYTPLIALLVLAGGLRFVGLTRGESDFDPSGQAGAEVYYHFHPDEETLVRAALRLQSLFEPPLTAYGTLPMLLGRAALAVGGVFNPGPLDFDGAGRAFALQTLRFFSAVLSLLTVALVYWFGRRHWGWKVGILAALFTAVAPVALQQAHFYTVDGTFALLALAVLVVGAEAVAADRRGLLIAAGALVGLAAATRLNGLLLGAVLALTYLLGPALDWRRASARLRRPDLWLAGLAAVGVLLALQPYLITQPGILLREDSSNDFGFSLKVARGEMLRPWSMADTHTTPFLHYWTDLWPQAVGGPLTVFFVLGFAWALWRREWAGLVLAGWCGVYFFILGGLHTKHVRYLLPLLGGLSLLAAVLAVEVQRRWRWPGLAAIGLVALHATAYGVAFAGIYRVEDSRIQAARWLFVNVPEGRNIGLETGGFSLQSLIDGGRYGKHFLNSGRLFTTRGYMTCATAAEYLQGQLSTAHFVALTDVNRYRQYTEVPRRRPVLHDFYTILVAGELGFAPVQRFAVSPSLLGLDFDTERGEPSFYGYDHPAVYILQRTNRFDADWAAFRAMWRTDPRCADADLSEVAALIQDGDLARAEARLASVSARYPHMRLAALIAADVGMKLAKPRAQQHALDCYVSGYRDKSLSGQLIPWAAGWSLGELGLPDQALAVLTDGSNKCSLMSQAHRTMMAQSYLPIASRLARRGDVVRAAEVYKMAVQIDPCPAVCNALAALASRDGRPQEALTWWEVSLELDALQVDILRLAGETAYHLGRTKQAFWLLARAVELDPEYSPAQQAASYKALAAAVEQEGDVSRAAEWRARARVLLGESPSEK